MSELIDKIIVYTKVFENGECIDKKLTSMQLYNDATRESIYIEFGGDLDIPLEKLQKTKEFFKNGVKNE